MIKRYELDEKDVKAAVEHYMRVVHHVDPMSIKINMDETTVGYHEEKKTVLTVIVEEQT